VLELTLLERAVHKTNIHNHDMTYVMNIRYRVCTCLWQLSLIVFRTIMIFLMQIWHCLRCLCY